MINKIGKILLKVVTFCIVFMIIAVGFGFDSKFDITPYKEML